MTIPRQQMRSCPPPHSMCAAILSPFSNHVPLATDTPLPTNCPLTNPLPFSTGTPLTIISPSPKPAPLASITPSYIQLPVASKPPFSTGAPLANASPTYTEYSLATSQPSSNIFPLATANPFSSLDPLPAVLRHHDFHMPQYLYRVRLSRLQPLCFAPHLPEMREKQLDHLPLCDRMDAALEIAPARAWSAPLYYRLFLSHQCRHPLDPPGASTWLARRQPRGIPHVLADEGFFDLRVEAVVEPLRSEQAAPRQPEVAPQPWMPVGSLAVFQVRVAVEMRLSIFALDDVQTPRFVP